MTLECTQCHARYSIDDSLIPAQGARVKCRKCATLMTIPAPVVELAPQEMELIPPSTKAANPQPATAPPRPEPAPSLAPAPAPSLAPDAGAERGMPAPVAAAEAQADNVPETFVERFPQPSAAPLPADSGFERFSPPTRFAAPPPFAEDPSMTTEAAATEPASAIGEALATESLAAEPALPPNRTPAASGREPDLSTSRADRAAAAPGAAIPDGLPPEERAKHERARRLARVLASDIAIYNREKKDRGIKDGNLVAVLGYEIKKSWEIYKERVGPEFANSTAYFRDALNEMLAEGKKIF